MLADIVVEETLETLFASKDVNGIDAPSYGDELYVASEAARDGEQLSVASESTSSVYVGDGAILVVSAADTLHAPSVNST